MKVPLSGLWQEFKAFAFKGNMIELAVAVVIGGAFSQVVNAMVSDIVMPSISYAVMAVSTVKDTSMHMAQVAGERTGIATSQPATAPSDAATVAAAPAPLPPPPPAPPAAKDPNKVVEFNLDIGLFHVGHFVGALLNFLIVAFAVFILIVKLLGSAMKRVAGSTPAPSEPTTKECPFCLSVIPLKAKKCANCTADLPVPA